MFIDPAAVGWFVLDVCVRAALGAAAVAVVLRLLRVRAAAVRHAAWTLALIAMLLMPLLPSVVPAVSLPRPIAGAVATTTADALPVSEVGQDTTAFATTSAAALPTRSDETLRSVPSDRRVAQRTVSRRRWLAGVSIAIYVAGLLFFLARLAYGWYLAAGLVRRAQRHDPVRGVASGCVYESSDVAVPMTVGAIRPVIVLPQTWREWDEETRAAVIAHEIAHVRRRDPLVSLIARLNRALFWFHPLAWWLERTLAIAAEHACDDAAVGSVEPRRYAEILIAMAEAVRNNGGRVRWQVVGVNGAGPLEGRIDRVLREEGSARTTTVTRVGALLGCAAAILLVIACRQQAAVTPLTEDPALSERLRAQDANVKKFEAARDMTEEQADALEKTLEANPEDADTRRQLVIHYTASGKVPWEKKVAGQRRHALWIIEHHPDGDVMPPALSPEYDPQGFAAAKKLWEARLAKPDVSPFLVYRAASFFAPHDKPYAEQLILRGMAMDPDSAALKARMPPDVGGYQWRAQLANLYAAAINGSESMWGTYNDLRTHAEQLDSTFAQTVRTKLDASSDAPLLAGVGALLVRQPGQDKDPQLQQAHDRARDLGVSYLRRALQLDQNLENARTALYAATARDSHSVATRLARQAEMASARADGTAAAKILEEARAHANDPAYAAAIMSAHQSLALSAARNGDRDGALRHLNDSLDVPLSDEIRYAPPMAWMQPVNELLKQGERERVVAFLEAYAQRTVRDRPRLLEDAKAVREGRMPPAYQYTAYRERTPSPFKPMR